MAINPTAPLRLVPSSTTAEKVAPTSAVGFGATLGKLIEAVDSSAGAANEAVTGMLQGTGDVHEAMIALQKAEMTFELTVQVRNKLIQAYQDVMRMPI